MKVHGNISMDELNQSLMDIYLEKKWKQRERYVGEGLIEINVYEYMQCVINHFAKQFFGENGGVEEFDLSKEELDNQHLHSGVGGLYRKEKVKEFIRITREEDTKTYGEIFELLKEAHPGLHTKVGAKLMKLEINRDKLAGEKLQ